MEICAICYESRATCNFFSLVCCRLNKICSFCLERLTVPTCPFCRETIPGLFPSSRKKKRNYNFLDEDNVPSRIERRQLRRLLKLELHENDRLHNRMRSWSM